MTVWRSFPALLWAGVIFWLSSQSELPSTRVSIPGFDKVLHVGAYGLLTALMLWGDRGPTGVRALLWATLASVYGISDEFHQSFIPSRNVEFWDVVADATGAFVVVWIWQMLHAQRILQGRSP